MAMLEILARYAARASGVVGGSFKIASEKKYQSK